MNCRYWLFSILLCILTALPAQAKIYATPLLADADLLLETSPEKALEITNRYLTQRRMSTPVDASRVHVSEETDHSIRTPLSTINALQIKARALSLLNRQPESIQTIREAESLAIENKFSYTLLETQFIQADILWQGLRDAATATNQLNKIDQILAGDEKLQSSEQVKVLQYHLLMLRADMESVQGDERKAEKMFIRAKRDLSEIADIKTEINFLLNHGRHYLRHQHYDLALDRLLSAYWLAQEQEDHGKMALANLELATLYEERKVFDKALEHATQAGEFFEHFNRTLPLARTLALIASIYEQQGRYNLALVHYFNALDQENLLRMQPRSSRLRLSIARVYLKLYNYPKTEQYLHHARQLAQENDDEVTLIQSQLLLGQLELAEEKNEQAITTLQSALLAASRLPKPQPVLQMQGEASLSTAFEKQKDYYNALLSQRRYEQLHASIQESQVQSNAEVFRQQQRIMARSLKLEELERQQFTQEKALYQQKNMTTVLLIGLLMALFLLWYRNRAARQWRERLTLLRDEFYTHPRSGLRNLRMLNDRLSSSLEQSSAHFEQWHLGEIINEPLSDRLRFALFEVPLLKHVYLQHGYQQGLELERQFGDYLKAQICEPARLYHFSDAMFLYIEPNSRLESAPRQLADSVQQLVDNFMREKKLDSRVRIGMAEYPFLPRAYTAINAQELIDILLMATQAARQISKRESGSQWVHLSAIDAAPAASFAGDNIRRACIQGMDKGLVKVQTSSCQEYDWSKHL
ncbi:GGDEF domain-containing protein [Photobacterium sp. 1_MG-2023]|uniref:tetratricopeptide repeat-containing diguanylate cyclase n=1 Tax=Photobacterium sp. 1_MG-2023 TaxID=3062646 RepID=UPI0026E47427|nr:GGDEF domain-containing protein [Photobacterium sp. 1_MG-2023]MDO6707784.1 GGDEF domain-containing protein [Photobacterium sp. 1_MG-2023]